MKNPTDFLVQTTKLPSAIESKLPAGAPKISTFMLDIASKLPRLPDLPVEIPDLPDIPMPGAPAPTPAGLTYVAGATIVQTRAPVVSPQSEKIPLVFE